MSEQFTLASYFISAKQIIGRTVNKIRFCQYMTVYLFKFITPPSISIQLFAVNYKQVLIPHTYTSALLSAEDGDQSVQQQHVAIFNIQTNQQKSQIFHPSNEKKLYFIPTIKWKPLTPYLAIHKCKRIAVLLICQTYTSTGVPKIKAKKK